jgi:hypothetical protein
MYIYTSYIELLFEQSNFYRINCPENVAWILEIALLREIGQVVRIIG